MSAGIAPKVLVNFILIKMVWKIGSGGQGAGIKCDARRTALRKAPAVENTAKAPQSIFQAIFGGGPGGAFGHCGVQWTSHAVMLGFRKVMERRQASADHGITGSLDFSIVGLRVFSGLSLRGFPN